MILVFVYGYSLVNWDFKENVGTKDSDSVAWSLEKEIDLRDGNKSYFINFTAAWCITCQVNEAVAFTDNVMEVFDNKDITYLKADWTNRNATIAKELEKYNRSGLPVYVYWNKNLDEPMVLNELLTEGYLMEIVNEN